MGSQEIRIRELKLANDLLGNCGIAKELTKKRHDRESFKVFLVDYKFYLQAALVMFDELLREGSGN